MSKVRLKLNEVTQMIHVNSSTTLTPAQIDKVLIRAKEDYMYAKFYTDKYFIQVNFMKDGSISVASNIRADAFLNDYRRNERQGWKYATVKTFIYQWMQVYRKILY